MNLLDVKNVSKKFKTIKAVDNISFSVYKGEILGLLGPNGAGKSTTISMISTLLKPDTGKILYKGKNINKNPKYIQQNLGYVPQEIALYPMLSGKENLIFWGRAYGLKRNELKSRIEEISKMIGINERLKDKVQNYSGGMKRRLNIGVALLHNPEIVIMDEPTVGIDPQSRKYILDTILELNSKGMTVIYTSHYMEEIEYLCDRICIMDEGKIIAVGTKDELVKKYSKTRDIILKIEGYNDILLNKIRNLDSVKEIYKNEEIIKIVTSRDDKVFNQIVNIITEAKINILSMDLKEVNLETVFLTLTGKELRD